MGRLNLDYLGAFSKGDTFIETGCLSGWTIDLAIKFGFSKIYGIELNPKWAEFCKNKFNSNTRVVILEGESPDHLNSICPDLHKQATFWLDAHMSGPELPGGKYGGTPLLHELNAISKSPYKEHVIFIDDVRLFDSNGWDYLAKSQVIEVLYSINKDYKITYIDGSEDGSLPKDIMLVTI